MSSEEKKKEYQVEEKSPACGGLTQQDCVAWDESHNIDLRRVTSPAYHTPNTPSTRASTSTAASSTAATATNQPRKSLLRSVAKCLSEKSNDKSEESTAAPEFEIDRIFTTLEREDVSVEAPVAATANSTLPDKRQKHVILGIMKSRKRQRQQQSEKDGQSKENEKNSTGSINLVNRRCWKSESGDYSDTISSPVRERKTKETADPFQDLLREMQSEPVVLSGSQPFMESSSRGPSSPLNSSIRRPSSVSNTQPPLRPNPYVTSSQPNRCNKQPQPEASTTNLPNTATIDVTLNHSVKDDEFGDIEFSMEDLVLMDSMVQQATQKDPEEINDCNDNPTNVQPAAPTALEETDPFGDFPFVDFEALDKSIAEHQQLTQNLISTTHPLNKTITQQQQQQSNSLHLYPSLRASSYLRFSRYRVVGVHDNVSAYTKILSVQVWRDDMLQQVKNGTGRSHSHSLPQLLLSPNLVTNVEPDGLINLCGCWYYTPIAERDVIHVCSPSGLYRTEVSASLPPLTLDSRFDEDLLLIVHPDMLLTATTISETTTCIRRAILKNRLGSTGMSAQAPLYGTLRHALFEEMMKERDFSLACAQKHCQTIIRRNAESLVACRVSSREAELEVLKVVPQIQRFANEFTLFGARKDHSSSSCTAIPNLEPAAVSPPLLVRFIARDVDSIEEPVISPELGLKGNIDMVVQAQTTNVSSLQTRMSLMSIELKTGHHQRTQNAHMAQLSLYTLMLSARYGFGGNVGDPRYVPCAAKNEGVLLYLNNESVKAAHVVSSLSDTKALIGQRNVVATETCRSLRPRGIVLKYQNEQDTSNNTPRVDLLDPTPAALPDVLNNSFTCEKCYLNRECMLYAGTAEAFPNSAHADSVKSTHQDLLQRFTANLRQEDFAYFMTWDRLVDLEADAGLSHTAGAWLVQSSERERITLDCISALCFDPLGSSGSEDSSNGSFSVLISFTRSQKSPLQTPLKNLSFEHGCQVIISTDDTTSSTETKSYRPQMHVVRGLIESISDNRLTVRATNNDLLRIQKLIQRSKEAEQLMFRLDRDEIATGVGTLRQNLVNLFSRDTLASEPALTNPVVFPNRLSWLRDVIVRLRKPLFDQKLVDTMFTPPETSQCPWIPGCDLMDLLCEYTELNQDQQAAANKVFSARDYSMIQGLPGTGKTSTIAFVARLLVAHGKRVLITSYTNAAVDNVLLKLMENGIAATGPGLPSPAMIRIGRDSSTHPGVQSILATSVAIALENSQTDCGDLQHLPSADCLLKCVNSARIVGATALSIPRSPLLVDQHFDVVIVDEAGQITQPAVIGALMAAGSFVLVGDHMQLPPLVVSELAELGGLGDSMLKRLAEAHPSSVAMLSTQYRMNQEICILSNEIVYKGALKCANEAVAHRILNLPGFQENLAPCGSWLAMAVNPTVPVVFVDTDTQGAEASSDSAPLALERKTNGAGGGGVVNDTEAAIVQMVVESLLFCGLTANRIGVVCPFRAQLRLLDEQSSIKGWRSQGLEVSTIDRFQGRDKDAIILSFVRSNLKGKVGRLLEDFRRLNVAVTRAKCKLVMIGSFSTLTVGSAHLRSLLKRLKSEGKVIAYR